MTVSVHPITTSRCISTETNLSALSALNYLSALADSVGSEKARFSTAFSFKRVHTANMAMGVSGDRKPYKGKNDLTSTISSSSETEDAPTTSDTSELDTCINNSLAGNSSLFVAAEGFWATVGWAFNASINCPPRWKYWKKWLGTILRILKSELPYPQETTASITRNSINSAANPILINSAPSSGASSPYIAPTLTLIYLNEVGMIPALDMRKLLRALFADASDSSLAEFHEVWPGETKPPKSADADKRGHERKKVDLDQGEFGDYWDDEYDDELPFEGSFVVKQENGVNPARTSKRKIRKRGEYYIDMNLERGLERSDDSIVTTRIAIGEDSPIDVFGGLESLQLRRQTFAWLANALLSHENAVANLKSLVYVTADFLRPLSLPVFSHFISPSTADREDLPDTTLARLHTSVLNTMSAGTHVPVFLYSLPTQEHVQYWYLPMITASNSASEIAKASLVVEALTRILWRNGLLKSGLGFQEAVEKGIDARQKKMDAALKRGKGKKDVEESLAVTEQANVRLSMLVNTVEASV